MHGGGGMTDPAINAIIRMVWRRQRGGSSQSLRPGRCDGAGEPCARCRRGRSPLPRLALHRRRGGSFISSLQEDPSGSVRCAELELGMGARGDGCAGGVHHHHVVVLGRGGPRRALLGYLRFFYLAAARSARNCIGSNSVPCCPQVAHQWMMHTKCLMICLCKTNV